MAVKEIFNFRSLGAPVLKVNRADNREEFNPADLLKKHDDYEAMSWSWRKIRLLCAGSDAVKNHDVTETKGEPGLSTFLLKPPGQSDDEYNFYVYNTRFFNATSRTLDVLMGLFFYRDPKVYAPEGMAKVLANIDGLGSSLVDFAKKVSREITAVGRCGILVDYPRIADSEGLTLSVIDKKQIQPFLSFYYAEDIYNWGFTLINNVRTITKVVLRENHSDDSLIRVLELVPSDYDEYGMPQTWSYRSRLFETMPTDETRMMKKDRKVWYTLLDEVIPKLPDGKAFDYIPFNFAGLTYDQADIQRPPMLDIADLNIDHYRKSADISSALFHCAHPTPIFCGFTFDKGVQIRLGAKQGISSKDAAAHASYLELNGQSITEIRKERDVITTELASLGARLLAQSGGSNQTAETSRIKASGDTAVMNILASTMGQLLARLITIMALWKGETGSVGIDMNTEFMPYRMDSQDILALINGITNNAIPIQDVLEALKNGGVVSPSRTLEDYLQDLAARPIGTPPANTPGTTTKVKDVKTQGVETPADGNKLTPEALK